MASGPCTGASRGAKRGAEKDASTALIVALLVSLILPGTNAGASRAGVGSAAAGIVELAGGRTQIRLNTHLLGDLGVSFYSSIESSVPGVGEELGTGEFQILETSVLGLSLPGGSYRGPVSGYFEHQGGFDLRWETGRVSLVGFELHPALPPDVFELRAVDGTVLFLADNPHPQRSPDGREFLLLDMDLRISGQLAHRLGRPEVEGVAVGEAHVRSNFITESALAGVSEGNDAGETTCTADFNGPVDVQLERMITVAETYHDDQRVAFAPAVELKNVGTADIKWFRSIAPDGNPPLNVVGEHPFLVMAIYQTAAGRIEQIGRSDVKHAFFAANTGPCNCQFDQVLFNDCTDVYGAATNAHRQFLAPRTEVEASTGAWISTGSHFDGPLPDDLRGHDEPDHPDPFEHRLSAAAADLQTLGAEYRVEAWYLVSGDVDIFNSMGHRRVAPTFAGKWFFPFTDTGLTRGSVLDSWIDPLALPPDSSNVVMTPGPPQGQLQLAVQATVRPGGVRHYEYALMNFDFDRQIDSFTVPLPLPLPVAGSDPLAIQNVWFGDGDSTAANDWQSTVSPGEITWQAPPGGALDWGTLHNFSFETNAAPAEDQVSLGVLETGLPASLAATAVVPSTLIPGATVEVVLTGTGTGGVTSSPVGIDCGVDCSEILADGTQLSLAATPAAGSAFARWEESATTLSLDTVHEAAIAEDLVLTAVFEPCQESVVLSPQTVVESTLFHACSSIVAGPGFHAEADVIFRSGVSVTLQDGFTVGTAAGFRVELVPEQASLPVG